MLLIDDDPDLLKILTVKLSKEGFIVSSALDANSGYKKIIDQNPDMILLDIDMPGKSGLELCKSLRSSPQNSELPIIILSAKDEQIDRLLGLGFGADDYVTKPFDIRELILRIKGLLKRVYSSKRTKDNFQFGCLSVDFDSHSVKVHGELVYLTLTEFKLLSHLVDEPGKTLTREYFLEKVWDYGEGIYSRTIDTHIQRLRTKLDEAGGYIQTVRGVGYRFNTE